jgi:hypothetical protein
LIIGAKLVSRATIQSPLGFGSGAAFVLMAAIGAIPADALSGFTVLGELGLDGSIAPVAGVRPAAIGANARGEGLICPAACGAEAAWASPEMEIIAAASLIQLANHFRGTQVLARPQPKIREASDALVDLKDIKGQESAKRPLGRDTLARPYVQRRLTALGKALRRKPLNVVDTNKAINEAVSKIVLNPERDR